MAFLGLRGLIAQSLRDGDQAQALGLCRARLRAQAADAVGRAFAVRHAGADRPVEGGAGDARHRHAPQGGERRQRPHAAGPAAGRAQPRRRARRQRRPTRWRWRARRSASRPSASPSPSRLAELQIKTGDAKRAMKTLERGWALAPHPDLAELYLKASGESDPLKRVGIVRRLAGAEARRHRKPSGARPGVARRRPVGRGAAASRDRRRHQPVGPRLPPDGRGRGARAVADQAKVHDWLARAADAPADRPGAAPPAARITRPGARCARAAAPSAPCTGARRAPSARSCRPRRGRSRSSA